MPGVWAPPDWDLPNSNMSNLPSPEIMNNLNFDKDNLMAKKYAPEMPVNFNNGTPYGHPGNLSNFSAKFSSQMKHKIGDGNSICSNGENLKDKADKLILGKLGGIAPPNEFIFSNQSQNSRNIQESCSEESISDTKPIISQCVTSFNKVVAKKL